MILPIDPGPSLVFIATVVICLFPEKIEYFCPINQKSMMLQGTSHTPNYKVTSRSPSFEFVKWACSS